MEIFILSLLTTLSSLPLANMDLSRVCFNKTLGEVISHPSDCRAYIVCGTETEVYYCESRFQFDNKRKLCNWPEYVKCQEEEPQPEVVTELEPKPTMATKPNLSLPSYAAFVAIDIMTGGIIDPLMSYDPQNVVCHHYGAYFLPHPSKCRSYLLCAYGYIHEHSCGHGTLWNYKLQQCVLNINAECYYQTPEEEEEIAASLTESSENPSQIPNDRPFFTTTPTSTTTKLSKQSITRTTTRPYSTFFVLFSSSPTTTLTPTTTTKLTNTSTTKITIKPYSTSSVLPSKKPNTTHTLSIVCPNKKQSYVAHPKDCSKYFICITGTPVLTSCPNGLLWDSKKHFCNVAKNVKCIV